MRSPRRTSVARSRSDATWVIVRRSSARRPLSGERSSQRPSRKPASWSSSPLRPSSPTSTPIRGSSRSSASSPGPTSSTRIWSEAIEVADRTLAAAERADLLAIVADTLVTKGTSLAYLGRAIEGLGLLAAGQLARRIERLRPNGPARGRQSLEYRAEQRPSNGSGDGAGRHRAGPPIGRSESLIITLGNGVGCAIRTGDWPWARRGARRGPHRGCRRDRSPQPPGDIGQPRRLARGAGPGHVEEMASIVGTTERTVHPLVDLDREDERSVRLGSLRRCPGCGTSDRRSGRRIPAARVGVGRPSGPLDGRWRQGPQTTSRHSTHPVSMVQRSMRIGRRSGPGSRPSTGARPRRSRSIARRSGRGVTSAWRGTKPCAALDMATLLDPSEPEVRAAAESAREILVRLEAKPFIARLDAAMSRSTKGTTPSSHQDRDDRRDPRLTDADAVAHLRHRPGPARPALPGRLHLGLRRLRLPDRGSGGRGRPRNVDLGHLRPPAGRHRRWRHGRCRLRPLPPLPARTSG